MKKIFAVIVLSFFVLATMPSFGLTQTVPATKAEVKKTEVKKVQKKVVKKDKKKTAKKSEVKTKKK